MFPWATWSRQKGAIKLHLTLDHAGYLPEAMVITTGKYSEMTIARRRRYARGTILVMDRGFVNFRWFRQLNQSGVLFITRIKKDTAYEIVESYPVIDGKGLVSDERIRVTGKKSSKGYPEVLRLVTINTAEGEQLQFLTNHLTLAAATIADVYKDRWQIEIFFKLIKQNLRIKSFVRHIRQCRLDSNLDSIDRDASDPGSPVESTIWLVVFKLGLFLTNEFARLS
jgi:putative transposase